MKTVTVLDEEAGTPEVELPPSVIRILSGALDAIAARGVKRLSMSDIIDASGVSRGTLYRYFSNKDQVLAAVAEFVCTGFENGIRDAGKNIADPIARLRAVMQFYSRYTEDNNPGRIFEVEPAFHLTFFRSRFGRYKQAVLDALGPTFGYLDGLLGNAVDRDRFAEMLVRIQLSTVLVPAGKEWENLVNDTADNILKWALEIAAVRNREEEGTQ